MIATNVKIFNKSVYLPNLLRYIVKYKMKRHKVRVYASSKSHSTTSKIIAYSIILIFNKTYTHIITSYSCVLNVPSGTLIVFAVILPAFMICNSVNLFLKEIV